MPPRLPALACLLCALCASRACAAGEVTIYRCTDAKGRLTLRDTPCRKGEVQQTRTMLRPTDPPPSRTAARAAAAPSTPSPARVVYVTPPRPLYECVTPDGERYTSDTGAGNPRWVPAWTVGVPVMAGPWSGGGGWRIDAGNGNTRIRIGQEYPSYPVAPVYAGGVWVSDECHALPQSLVCERLREERYTLDRRYNSALQSERTRISTEQRGIDARLANDCGDNG